MDNHAAILIERSAVNNSEGLTFIHELTHYLSLVSRMSRKKGGLGPKDVINEETLAYSVSAVCDKFAPSDFDKDRARNQKLRDFLAAGNTEGVKDWVLEHIGLEVIARALLSNGKMSTYRTTSSQLEGMGPYFK